MLSANPNQLLILKMTPTLYIPGVQCKSWFLHKIVSWSSILKQVFNSYFQNFPAFHMGAIRNSEFSWHAQKPHCLQSLIVTSIFHYYLWPPFCVATPTSIICPPLPWPPCHVHVHSLDSRYLRKGYLTKKSFSNFPLPMMLNVNYPISLLLLTVSFVTLQSSNSCC